MLAENAQLVVSADIINEVGSILKREIKFGLSDDDIGTMIDTILHHAEIVEPNVHVNVIKADPSDNKFLSCAIEGGADFIVSGDSHLLKLGEFRGIKILTAKQMLEKLVALD